MKTAVFVDDEPLALQGLEDILPWSNMGYNVAACCTDPYEALSKIKAIRPDVVFTDIRMPGMSGLDLISAVRDAKISSEFVIISSYSDFMVAQKAILYDVCQYLLKPFDREDVSEAVSRLQNKLNKKEPDVLPGSKKDLCDIPEYAQVFSKTPGLKSYFCVVVSDKELFTEEQGIPHARLKSGDGYWVYLAAVPHSDKSMVKTLFSGKSDLHIGISRLHPDYLQLQKLMDEARASYDGGFFYADHSLVADIQSYICGNYMHTLSLHDIAARFYISDTYLCEVFKKQTGLTFISFLNQIRLSHAAALLAGDKELKQIAEETGFQDYNYFRKIFKRKYSVSPENFRNRFN